MEDIVIITGATSGLGRALVERYATAGDTVIATGRNREALDDLKDLGHVIGIAGDITSQDTLGELVYTAGQEGGLDILINNAGILYYQPFTENTPEQWERIFAVNVWAPMFLTQGVYPIMQHQGDGHIVNIVSTSGLSGRENHSMYCATKFGLRGFTDALRTEAKRDGIRVTGVYPGGMQTELFDRADSGTNTSKFMDPAEVAQLIYDVTQRKSLSTDTIVVERMSK